MNVEIIWPEGESGVTFRHTNDPVDRVTVWPSLQWAKMSAVDHAKTQRDLWAARVKEIQAVTEQDIGEWQPDESLDFNVPTPVAQENVSLHQLPGDELCRHLEDVTKAYETASGAADRFREVICEVLGREENPGDDMLVADLRSRFGGKPNNTKGQNL